MKSTTTNSVNPVSTTEVVSKDLQANSEAPKGVPGQKQGPDQIHNWLSLYSDSRDPALRDSIIQAALPLVKRIAYGLARRSTDPVEDLIQVGSIGLIKARDQFKPDAGAKFQTYATHLITG